MTTTPTLEPMPQDVTNTLQNLANKIDKLAVTVKRNLADNDSLQGGTG